MIIYGFVFLNVILLVIGQLLFKLGLDRIGAVTLTNLLNVFLSPWIWAGLILYVIATILWFAALSRANLSAVYPLQSLSYLVGIILSVVILHESVTPMRWIGTLVILLGVMLVSWPFRL